MKQIQIIIAKKDIFDEVALRTAYTGVKNGDNDSRFFQKVSTVKADNPLLDRFWREMSGDIADRLQPFLVSCSCNDETLSLSLELSGGYDDALTPTVKTDLFAALAAGITQRWFSFSYPEHAREWTATTETLLSRILSKLCSRKKPVKKFEKLGKQLFIQKDMNEI